MADPRPLFYVTGLVLVGLVAWVVSIWARPGEPWAIGARSQAQKGEPAARDAEASESPRATEPAEPAAQDARAKEAESGGAEDEPSRDA